MTVPTRAPRSAPRRARLAAAGAVLAAALLWAGCQVTEDNYDTLSFWFDGVPPPWREGRADARIQNSPTYTAHQPWLEQKCQECHGRRFDLSALQVDSTVCLNCHQEVRSALPRMHGPVVAAACLWCHDPHESPYTALLKGPAHQVCSACHAPGMLGTAKTPEHAPEARADCLECHAGHGGSVRFFLRPQGHGLSAPAPAPTGNPPSPGSASEGRRGQEPPP